MTVDASEVESDLCTKKKIGGSAVVVGSGLAVGLLVGQVISSAYAIALGTMLAYSVADEIFIVRWGYGWDKADLFTTDTDQSDTSIEGSADE